MLGSLQTNPSEAIGVTAPSEETLTLAGSPLERASQVSFTLAASSAEGSEDAARLRIASPHVWASALATKTGAGSPLLAGAAYAGERLDAMKAMLTMNAAAMAVLVRIIFDPPGVRKCDPFTLGRSARRYLSFAKFIRPRLRAAGWNPDRLIFMFQAALLVSYQSCSASFGVRYWSAECSLR